MTLLTILCRIQVIHLLFNRAEAKDSIHELNAAEQMKENMKLKDQIMAKDVEISLLKESLIENGNHTICNDHTVVNIQILTDLEYFVTNFKKVTNIH